MHEPNPNPLSPDEALNRLKEGHQRFLEGRPLRPHASRERLRDLAESQWPMAAVLGCADSRVPVELLFDSGFGDLFVTRNAGNQALPGMVASLEYAVACLGVPVILLLAHERCGAVAAALDPDTLNTLPAELAELISEIREELLDPSEDGGEIPTGKTIADLDRATRRNALLNLRRLSEDSPLIAARVQDGSLRLVAAHYDLDDHCLEWLVEA